MVIMSGSDAVTDNICITSNNAGGAIIAWDSQTGTQNAVHTQSVTASGNLAWGISGVTISTLKGYFVEAVSDGNGGAYFTWLDDRAAITYRNLYTQYVNADGIVQWQGDGIAVKLSSFDQAEHHMIADGLGGAYMVFFEWATGNHTVTNLQHFGATGAIWPTCATVTTSQGWQYESSLTLNATGGAIVAWGDQRNEGDVYAQNLCGNGSLGTCLLNLPEVEAESDVAVFPNPSNGHFTVRSSAILTQISITDMLGKKILAVPSNAREEEIFIPQLKPGIYFVKMISGESETVKKIIIN